jgi:hypothetical protein
MFSLISQKVMSQPPLANKKKQYEIHEVLGTGLFRKVMVRMRCVYTLPFPPRHRLVRDMARTTRTVEP